MGNTQDKLLNDPEIQKIKPKFSPLEMYMLGLLFKDLAARNDEFIDKETFLQFFPLTGLWGEKLFEKFDYKHTGYINFYGFLQGIACCCKSAEDDKVHLLFSLYDMDQDGYIKKKEMITMLYNYPKNHIKFITEEIAPDHGEKLEQVSEARRLSLNNIDDIDNVLVSPHHQRDHEERGQPGSIHSEHIDGALNDELIVADEDKKAQKFLPVQREISKSYSFYTQRESQIQMQIQAVNDANKKSAHVHTKKLPQLDMRNLEEPKKATEIIGSPDQIATRKNSLDKNIPRKAANKDTNFPAPDPLKLAAGRKSSTSTVILDQSFVAATTVNTRVKEYASFIFRSFEGANSRGKISYDEFKQWIAMHPMILKVFDETFHQDIWLTPEIPPIGESFVKKSTLDLKGHLQYRDKPAEMAGYLNKTRKVMKGWKKRYFELREHFLFFYNKKEDKQPKGVIFLNGCEVEELKDFSTTKKYGFKISHKSDTYENHLFYCSDKKEFDEWMTHLKDFNSANILQKYTFHEKIGTGKFSVVYRASCKTNKDEEYAIKVIDKKLLKPEEKEFLLSETSVMKILDHPNVIKLIDTIETKTHIYIITEIVKDGDLFDYIINREFLEEYDASFIMKQLITSIYFLHNIGIIHRDLKPENLLISLGDFEQVKEVKIIDFGFAKLINEGEKLRDTCGTPNYVAPEVLRGTGYDRTADVWSLGVIMYLMVRGYLPFDAHDVNVILKNTLKAEVPLDDEHWEKCSPEARDLVSRFLHKDPSKRISLVDAAQHPWIKNREALKMYVGVNRTGGTNESNSGVAYYGAV